VVISYMSDALSDESCNGIKALKAISWYINIWEYWHTKLPATAQAPLDRHSPVKQHLPVVRRMEVSSGGQLLSSGWPHYPPTKIRPTQMLLGTPKLLLDQPRPLHILSKEEGHCSNWTCALVANAKRCHILSTAACSPSWRGLHSADDVATKWLKTCGL